MNRLVIELWAVKWGALLSVEQSVPRSETLLVVMMVTSLVNLWVLMSDLELVEPKLDDLSACLSATLSVAQWVQVWAHV